MFFQQVLNGVILGGVYALIALGFTMMFGIAKIGNFAHGSVIMWGAYLTLAFVTMGLNFFLAMFLSMILLGVFGLVVQKIVFEPVLKRDLIYTFLVSIGLMFFLNNLSIAVFGANTQNISFPVHGVLLIGNVSVSYQRIIVLLITVCLILALQLFLHRSRMGRAIRAASQDIVGARAVGINLKKVNMIIFVISCALASVAGALYGSMFSVEPNMGFQPLIKAFAIVVLGGVGSIWGAVLGALILGVSEAMGQAYLPSAAYAEGFAFIIMIAILLVKPSGLMGEGD